MEQVAVRNEAHALVPGIVGRGEVGGDVVVRPEVVAHPAQDAPPGLGGALAGEIVEEDRHQHVAPAHEAIGERLGQPSPQVVGQRVHRRARDHIARRPLQHGDVACGARERRDEGHRRRPAADHHHAPAGVVQVLRPGLGVDEPAPVAVGAGKARHEPARVVVVARAGEQEAAGEADGRVARPLHLQRPGGLRRGPGGLHDLVAEADQPVRAVLGRRLADVAQDGGPVGDGLGLRPRPEDVAERVHVAVGADAGVAEQVPRPADRLARLKDQHGAAGTFLLQVVRRPDAGEPRADDDDVVVARLHQRCPCVRACIRAMKSATSAGRVTGIMWPPLSSAS